MLSAYKEFWKRYADFNGKSTRSEFWYSTLMNFLIDFGGILIVMIFSVATFGGTTGSEELGQNAGFSGGSILIVIFYFLLGIYFLAAVVPSLAISVRRLRDANLPWGLIFLGFIPFFGGLILLVLFCQPSVSQSTNNSQTDKM